MTAFPGYSLCWQKRVLVSVAFLIEEFWIMGHSSGEKTGKEIRRLGKVRLCS